MSLPVIGSSMVQVPRDRWERPLVLLPEHAPNPELAAILLKPYSRRTKAELDAVKGKTAYYTRCTTLAKAVDDVTTLTKWKLRMVALGLSERPDLMLNVAAYSPNPDAHKRALDDICEDALEAAKGSRKANIGTALHKLAEYADDGVNVPGIGSDAQRDLAAYADCKTRYGVTMHGAEQFVICDELQAAGTFDRVMEVATAPSRTFVGDIKTGSIEYAGGAIAIQLAVYAHSQQYDPTTGARSPLGVDLSSAIVIHLPQGSGTCELYWSNIAAGWEAAQLARTVRAWRTRKELLAPFAAAS